jgi:hypothetical protein
MLHGIIAVGASVAVSLAMGVVTELTVAFVDFEGCTSGCGFGAGVSCDKALGFDVLGSAGLLKLNSDSMGCLFTISLNRTLSQIGVHVCCAFTKNGLASNSLIYWHVTEVGISGTMATATSPSDLSSFNLGTIKAYISLKVKVPAGHLAPSSISEPNWR